MSYPQKKLLCISPAQVSTNRRDHFIVDAIHVDKFFKRVKVLEWSFQNVPIKCSSTANVGNDKDSAELIQTKNLSTANNGIFSNACWVTL